MEVEFADGETDTVRLLGVDTPEVTLGDVSPGEYEGFPESQAARDHLFNWGERASSYAVDQLDGQQVRVVTDPESDRRGSFDRLLAYIFVDGTNFNRGLLENGYARVYDSSFSLRGEFDGVESQARSNDVGLWDYGVASTPTPTTTSDSSDGGSGDLETPTPSGGASDPYDCSDFESGEVVQQWFENHNPEDDPADLDGDGDGEACESL